MKVRRADQSDSHDIFQWRNDPVTRQMSHCQAMVQWDEHCQWFENTLNRKDRCLLICEQAQTANKVAVVRFDIEDTSATVSINLAPSSRGQGWGKMCLTLTVEFFKSLHPEITCVLAETKPQNIASQKSFEGAGFHVLDKTDTVISYRLML